MGLENLKVLLLHHHPQYLKACCDLINDEWPRSETARMMSLQASRDELPTSLILTDDQNHLLGHCKLTSIPSKPESCFIETVVISKTMRGKKLGTYLMTSAEEYCKTVLKLKMVHLATKGQENFYAKLGYVDCAPVSIYGSGIPSIIKPFVSNDKVQISVPIKSITSSQPPPPPPMPKSDIVINNSVITTKKTYMCKNL